MVALREAVAEPEAVAVAAAGPADGALLRGRPGDIFVAFAAHELRSPAVALKLLAAGLVAEPDLPPERLIELGSTMQELSSQLLTLIGQLLDLSRLETGAAHIAPERFLVRAQVERILHALDPGSMPAGDIDLAIADDLEVSTDPAAFERILSNLVRNARRYGRPPISIDAARHGTRFHIRVSDNGAGVPDLFVPELIHLLRRGPNTAGSRGSGLGLAIAQAFAAAQGGAVRYEQRKPHGASFELAFPCPG